MIVFVLILAAVICSGLTVCKKDEFYMDYCSLKNTSTINAIFSILIFLSHAVQYINPAGVLDVPYLNFRAFHSQLVVVTYLFFSGYGIMESIKKKGTDYVKAMPVNRLFKLWYHFAIAVLMFTVVCVGIAHKEYTISRWLLSFIGLRSVGNSNWYLFATFTLYILVIVSFLIFKKSKKAALLCMCVLTVGLVLFEMTIGKSKLGITECFYNTILCFPLGMVFSMLKPYFDKIFMKNDILWFFGFSASVLLFAYFSQNRNENFPYYVLFTFFALAVIVFFMMKVNIRSSVLDWFGQHIFSFFILQRIPMIILKHFGYNKDVNFFIIVSFFGTVFLAVMFDAFTDKLDSMIFKNKIIKNNKLV
ncbi:MAG: acyltransferase family protein [Acutalibacteraceae bacterium]